MIDQGIEDALEAIKRYQQIKTDNITDVWVY